MLFLQKLTYLICPFDNAPILRWFSETDEGYSCPNCGIDYKIKSETQEQINNYFKVHLIVLKKELQEINEKKNGLEYFINHAENSLIFKPQNNSVKDFKSWIRSDEIC